MGYLKNINRFSGKDNVGGLIEIKLAPVEAIASIPSPIGGVIYENVQFVPGYAWTQWLVRPFDSGIRSRSKDSQEGNYKEYSLQFLVPRDAPEMAQMLRIAESDLFVILATDANGEQKLIGTLDAPLKFRFDHSTGNSQRSLNHYECEFFSESPDASYFYQGGSPTVPPGQYAPVLIKRGDGVLLAALQPGEVFTIISGFSFGFRIT